MLDRINTIGFRVRTLSLSIKRAIDAGKAQKGCCTNTHGWVIGYLYDNRNKDVYQRDIEKRFSVRRPTMTEILKLMEKNGLIERVRDESDARLKKIKLTPKAMEIHERQENEIEAFENFIRRGISDEEMALFYSVMDKIAVNVETAEKEKSFGTQEVENA